MRHGEIFAQVIFQRANNLVGQRLRRAQQRECEAMHFFRQCVVVAPDGNEIGYLMFKAAHLVAQRQNLSFRERNRSSAMRVRDEDLRQCIGVLFKKFWMLLKVFQRALGRNRGGCSHVPILGHVDEIT